MRDLRRAPAFRAHGIPEGPAQVGAFEPLQAHVQAFLVVALEEGLIVSRGGLQLLGRVQRLDRHQTTFGQLPEARDAFVEGVVDFQVLALQIDTALPAGIEPDELHPDVVLRAHRRPGGALPVRPQASSIRAEVAGQWVSSSMASYKDATIRSNASRSLMSLPPPAPRSLRPPPSLPSVFRTPGRRSLRPSLLTSRAPHRHASVRQRQTTYPGMPLEANRLEGRQHDGLGAVTPCETS